MTLQEIWNELESRTSETSTVTSLFAQELIKTLRVSTVARLFDPELSHLELCLTTIDRLMMICIHPPTKKMMAAQLRVLRYQSDGSLNQVKCTEFTDILSVIQEIEAIVQNSVMPI